MKYFSRDSRIYELAANRKLLHLGCVGFADMETSERVALAKQSLHYTLTNIANTTGVDYSREAIAYYKDNGIFTNVVYGNVEKLEDVNIADTFDVVVAGDIIEHLSNPGLMLEGIKRFLRTGSVLIITTPHSFGLMNFLRHCAGKFVDGKEHVMTFNSQNISNLLTRHGYRSISIDTCFQEYAKTKKLFSLGRALFNFMPGLGGTLFVVAEIDKETGAFL